MKNFFKKLAFVLALAMVVTAIAPAATASAAKAPALSTTGKKLYIGGDKTGEYSNKFTLKVWNKGDYSVTFASDNTKIATVTKWYGVVEAKAVGTATITATVTNKTTKKVVKTLSAKVYVKKNATSVAFGKLTAFDEAFKIGQTQKINVKRAAGTVAVWSQPDKSEITDYLVWESSNTEVATVSKWGTVKAVGAGEATITATAYQTEGKVATTEPASVKITVKAGMTAVKQTSASKVEITFGAPVTSEAVNKSTLTLTTSAGVNQSSFIKSVTLSDDKKTATVELFVNFTNKEVYTFANKDMNTIDFAASYGDVAKVVISEPVFVSDNEPATIKVKYYDANGIEVNAPSKSSLSFSFVDSNVSTAFITGNQITMFKIGETVAIKGLYMTGEYDTTTYAEKTIEIAPFVVTCVDDASAKVNSLVKAIVSTKTTTPSDSDFTDGTLTVPAETSNFRLWVKAKKSDGTPVTSGFKFESTDPSKLVVNNADGTLFPIASSGVVGVIVTQGDFKTVVNVVISSKVAAANLKFDKPSAIVSNGSVDNQVAFNFNVLDNYGNKVAFTTSDVKVESIASPNATTTNSNVMTLTPGYVNSNTVNLTASAAGLVKGTYTFRITAKDKSNIISVQVLDATNTTALTYRLTADQVSVDVAIDANTTAVIDKNVTIQGYGINSNGAAVDNATNVVYKVKKANGTVLFNNATASTVTNAAITLNSDVLTVAPVYANGNTITIASANYGKLAAGVYTVEAYVYINNTTKAYVPESTALASPSTHTKKSLVPTTFTVTDTQAAPSYTKSKATAVYAGSISNTLGMNGDANACFKVDTTAGLNIEGYTVKGTVNPGVSGTYNIYVEKIKIKQTFTGGNSVITEVAVGTSIAITVE